MKIAELIEVLDWVKTKEMTVEQLLAELNEVEHKDVEMTVGMIKGLTHSLD